MTCVCDFLCIYPAWDLLDSQVCGLICFFRFGDFPFIISWAISSLFFPMSLLRHHSIFFIVPCTSIYSMCFLFSFSLRFIVFNSNWSVFRFIISMLSNFNILLSLFFSIPLFILFWFLVFCWRITCPATPVSGWPLGWLCLLWLWVLFLPPLCASYFLIT